MNQVNQAAGGSIQFLIRVDSEAPGRYTVQAVGIPEIQATATTKIKAIEDVQKILNEWLASGRLMSVELTPGSPLLKWIGSVDPNDPNQQVYLDELERMEREDLEQSLKELDERCSSSSSTPTT